MPAAPPMMASPAPIAPPSQAAPLLVRNVARSAAAAAAAVSCANATDGRNSIAAPAATVPRSTFESVVRFIIRVPFISRSGNGSVLSPSQSRLTARARPEPDGHGELHSSRYLIRIHLDDVMRIVMLLSMTLVMEHHRHADEQRRQEREDERLQKRDEQLEKVDRDAARHDERADDETESRAHAARRHDEREQHSQQNVAGD